MSAFSPAGYNYFAKLKCAKGRALMLDYDGIADLIGFRMDRPSAVSAAIRRIHERAGTRVVLLTSALQRELRIAPELEQLPCELWTANGRRRCRPDGSVLKYSVSETDFLIFEQFASLLEYEGLGKQIELQNGSVLVRWNNLPLSEQREARFATLRAFGHLGSRKAFRAREIPSGFEFVLCDWRKIDGVRTLMNEMGGACGIAYLGSGAEDEEAFVSLLGQGVTVLVRPGYTPTCAGVWIGTRSGFMRFLEAWVCELGT